MWLYRYVKYIDIFAEKKKKNSAKATHILHLNCFMLSPVTWTQTVWEHFMTLTYI